MTKRYPISNKAHAFCGRNEHSRPFGKRLANKSTRLMAKERPKTHARQHAVRCVPKSTSAYDLRATPDRCSEC